MYVMLSASGVSTDLRSTKVKLAILCINSDKVTLNSKKKRKMKKKRKYAIIHFDAKN